MPAIIRLGDPTSHGGKVVSVSAQQFIVGGKPVARVGDTCSCPMPGHGPCTIVEGSSKDLVGGVAIAYHGHKTSCGAALISTSGNFSTE